MADPLVGFEREPFTAEGKTRDLYRAGSGPAVIVMSEIPGITPLVAEFGRRVAAIGCTAVMPHMFGTPGKTPTGGYAMQSLAHACISHEFSTMASGRTSPITTWLRALAKAEHDRCGGPGVGAVGMCLTGGFALAMMVDDVMVAPVLSQPSLPFPMGSRRKKDLGISSADLMRVKQRAEAGTDLLGLRFTGDPLCPPQRFERLREELGDRFIAVEIDSSPENAHGHPKGAHSVLTEHLIDSPGTPTREALDKVLDFYRERLLADS